MQKNETPNHQEIQSSITTAFTVFLQYLSALKDLIFSYLSSSKENTETQPSITAFAVIWGYLRALNDPSLSYLSDSREIALINHLFITAKNELPLDWKRILIELTNPLPYSFQQSIFFQLTWPAFDHIIWLRKYFIAEQIDAFTKKNNGGIQVVNFGGGLDGRLFMLSLQHKESTFFELDRGSTRSNKLKGIRSLPIANIGFDDITINELEKVVIVNYNLYYIHCDLAVENLETVLLSHGFDPNKKTFFLAEGLTMYLSEKENQCFLSSINGLLKDEDELLISVLPSSSRLAVKDTAQASTNETFKFHLKEEEALKFFGDLNFNMCYKFIAKDALAVIKNPSTQYHEDNREVARETYYSVKKASPQNVKYDHVSNVPMITLTLPPRPENTIRQVM